MAKKNKIKATKLPKRIAGVKIPKTLRRRGGRVANALRHPLVADLAAAGLVAAAVAIKDNQSVRAAAAKAKRKASKAASEMSQGAATLGTVIAAKASESAKRLGESYQGLGAGWPGNGGQISGGKKKKGRKH